MRVSEAIRAEAQCESLFKLFDGALGTVELGRLLKGGDAGRLVILRQIPHAPSPDLASATDLARSVAHPRLVKVLGSIAGRGAWYVASEYIAGVTLFELSREAVKQGGLEASVAVRVVLDTLTAAADAQQLLATTANLRDVRCVFPESVWIATYGEVFVSEVLIAPLLADASGASDRALPAALADLRTAGRELSSLLGPAAQLRPALTDILRRLASEGDAYSTLRAAAVALRELGSELIADEEQVSEELQRVLGRVLEHRNQKILLLERGATQATDDEQTRYFRVSSPPERHSTTRPPELGRELASSYSVSADNSKTGPSEAPNASTRSYSGNGDNSRTEPPAGESTVIVSTRAPGLEDDAEPTVTPGGGGTPVRIELEEQSNPISDVWRQARDLMGTSALRAKQRGQLVTRPQRRSPVPQRSTLGDPAPELPRSGTSGTERLVTLKVALTITGVLALATAIRVLW